MVALHARLADGVDQDGEQHDGCRCEHDRRQPIGDERDAERRWPVTGLHDDDPLTVDVLQDDDRQHDECRQRRDADDPLRRPVATAQDRQRGGDEGQDDRSRQHSVHATTPGSVASSSDGLLDVRVGDLDVGAGLADGAVVGVVGHLVVVGQQPAAVGEREQQRRDAEADDDRRQHERLRDRVGEVTLIAGADDRRAAPLGRRDEHDVGAVADQSEADDQPRQLALHEEVGADAEQHCRRGGHQHAHAVGSLARSAGSLRRCRHRVVTERLEDHQGQPDDDEVHADVEGQR